MMRWERLAPAAAKLMLHKLPLEAMLEIVLRPMPVLPSLFCEHGERIACDTELATEPSISAKSDTCAATSESSHVMGNRRLLQTQ